MKTMTACRGFLAATLLLAGSSALAVGKSTPADGISASAKRTAGDTVTWYCVDLNDVFKVNVPVVVNRRALLGGLPCATMTTSSWPIAVAAGSGWVTNNAWVTNKTYPKAVVDALLAMPGGYDLKSNSPLEDFLAKITRVSYQVSDFATGVLVAEFTFDPQKVFKRLLEKDLAGTQSFGPFVDPSLGIDIDTRAALLLPAVAFPGIGGALPPGAYVVFTVWTLSERHCDGLGIDPDNNCIAAGDFVAGGALFDVVP